MASFKSLLLVVLIAISEARNLKKGTKTPKDSKAPKQTKSPKDKMYKGTKTSNYPVQLGSRPYYIADSMDDGPLKTQLETCAENQSSFEKSDWSIGHRGACSQVCFVI